MKKIILFILLGTLALYCLLMQGWTIVDPITEFRILLKFNPMMLNGLSYAVDSTSLEAAVSETIQGETKGTLLKILKIKKEFNKVSRGLSGLIFVLVQTTDGEKLVTVHVASEDGEENLNYSATRIYNVNFLGFVSSF